jgi:hypothetical protein
MIVTMSNSPSLLKSPVAAAFAWLLSDIFAGWRVPSPFPNKSELAPLPIIAATSLLPSSLKSPIASLFVATGYPTCGKNVPSLFPIRTETSPATLSATTKSRMPSLFRSSAVMAVGPLPTA